MRAGCWAAVVAAVIGLGACSCSRGQGRGDGGWGDGGAGGGGGPALPADLESQLARTDAGLPVVLRMDTMFGPGVAIGLVYDRRRDDPVARWADCMQRVVGCYRTADGPIAGCVDQIPRCASDEGGAGCCPPACLDEFAAALAGGADEDAAYDASFRRGACVRGFAEQTAAPVQP